MFSNSFRVVTVRPPYAVLDLTVNQSREEDDLSPGFVTVSLHKIAWYLLEYPRHQQAIFEARPHAINWHFPLHIQEEHTHARLMCACM